VKEFGAKLLTKTVSSQIGSAVESYIAAFPHGRGPGYGLKLVLAKLQNDEFDSADSWFEAVTAHINSTALLLNPSSPAGSCLLTLLFEMRREIQAVLTERDVALKAAINRFHEIIEDAKPQIPNSKFEWQEAIWRYESRPVPVK
jgi:hypothetical protein